MAEAPNLRAFFYARWEAVELHLRNDSKVEADDICRELIANYACPHSIRISAWQVRAICAGEDQYYRAMECLKNALALCDQAILDLLLQDDDQEVARFKQDTLSMIEALEHTWTKKWRDVGRPAPTEAEIEAQAAELEAEEELVAQAEEELAAQAEAKALRGEVPLPDDAERAATKTFMSSAQLKEFQRKGMMPPPREQTRVSIEDLPREVQFLTIDAEDQEREDMDLALKAAGDYMAKLRADRMLREGWTAEERGDVDMTSGPEVDQGDLPSPAGSDEDKMEEG